MAQNITLMGASYSAVPAVTLPKTGGGTASFTDVTPTTATDSDVASGKVYFKSDGTQSTGTASGSSVTVEQYTVTSAGTHTAPTGKAYSPVIVGSGTATAPASISSSGATASNNGTNVVLTKTVSVTPSVTAGYIASGTAGNCEITMQATDTNFLAENIKSGVTLFGLLGTYTGGGGSSPWHKLVNAQENTVSTTSTSAASAFTIALGSSAFTKDQIIWVHIRDKSGARNGYFFGSDAFFINYNKASSSTSTFSVPAVLCIRYNNSAYSGTAGQYGVYGYSINSSGTLTVRKRYNSSYSLTVNGTYVTNVYALDLPDSLKLFT